MANLVVKKVCPDLKMAAILEILKYQTQLHFDLSYAKIARNYAKKVILFPKSQILYSIFLIKMIKNRFKVKKKKILNIFSQNFKSRLRMHR